MNLFLLLHSVFTRRLFGPHFARQNIHSQLFHINYTTKHTRINRSFIHHHHSFIIARNVCFFFVVCLSLSRNDVNEWCVFHSNFIRKHAINCNNNQKAKQIVFDYNSYRSKCIHIHRIKHEQKTHFQHLNVHFCLQADEFARKKASREDWT